MLGQGLDSAVFLTMAFGGVFETAELVRLCVSVWAIKVAWEVCALPLSLPLIAFLKREEGEDAFDARTDFNPFTLRE